jgi:hypothetical protein
VSSADVTNVMPMGTMLPTNERQVGSLTVSDDQPDVQRGIWEAAVETAPTAR